MQTIVTEIIINASKEKVWDVLTSFDSYSNWNPFIISIEGKPIENTQLINKLDIDGKIQTFKPTVVRVEKNKHFEWIGKLPLGMFTGHHCFEIQELQEGQVKLIQKENFSGWLSSLILKQVKESTIAGFIKMNKGLKVEAEKGV